MSGAHETLHPVNKRANKLKQSTRRGDRLTGCEEYTVRFSNLPDNITMASLRKIFKEKGVLPGFHIKTLKDKIATVKFLEDEKIILDKLDKLVIDKCEVEIQQEFVTKEERTIESHQLPDGIDERIVRKAANLDKNSLQCIEFSDEKITLVFPNKDKIKLQEFLQNLECAKLESLCPKLEATNLDDQAKEHPAPQPVNATFASRDVRDRVEKVKDKCLGDFFPQKMS